MRIIAIEWFKIVTITFMLYTYVFQGKFHIFSIFSAINFHFTYRPSHNYVHTYVHIIFKT